MGRLFWKFLFALLLAQGAAILGVSLLIGLHVREHFDSFTSPAAATDPWEHSRWLDLGPSSTAHRDRASVQQIVIPAPPQLLPPLPLVSGLAASLLFAVLMAWYFSKPIRHLSRAFESVSQGDLTVRLGADMGRRSDELADLGHDFDDMAQRLQLLLDGQRRLFHDVSHELRSPLARMQAAIGLARQHPERAMKTLDRLERESMRMDRLVSELLTLARLESGMAGNQNEPVALNELLHDIIEDARIEAEARACTLRLDMHGDAHVHGNPELLRRAIENVLRNAIKHSPADSQVAIELRLAAPELAEIITRDHGPGVAPEALAGIFQPFFRGTQASDGGGYGLGLAIAHSVVDMHDGSISARNLSEGGLEVRIALPTLPARKEPVVTSYGRDMELQ